MEQHRWSHGVVLLHLGGELPTNRKWVNQPWWFQWDKWGQCPLITRVITHLLSGMNQQVGFCYSSVSRPYSFCTLPGRRWSKDRTGVVSCVFLSERTWTCRDKILYTNSCCGADYIFPWYFSIYTIYFSISMINYVHHFPVSTRICVSNRTFFHERPWRADTCIFHKWFLSFQDAKGIQRLSNIIMGNSTKPAQVGDSSIMSGLIHGESQLPTKKYRLEIIVSTFTNYLWAALTRYLC